MKRFKDTYVSRKSALAEAMLVSQLKAEQVYNETKKNFRKLYGKEDSAWFESFMK